MGKARSEGVGITPGRAARIGPATKGAPDISTLRTDAYIVRWADKDPNDPFWKD